MRKYILFLLHLLFITVSSRASEKTSLEGKVTDTTGTGLPGASVYFADLKRSAVTDVNGNYHFEDLPKGKFLVQVQMEGYSSLTEQVDLNTVTHKDFVLRESVTEIGEVVVTGQQNATDRNRTPSPIDIVTRQDLVKNSSTNIIDAIAHKPGISQVSTGAGISKPVIRGLGYNRVVVVNDGIRQEGQQWGDEHGIEIDEFSVSKIEILKGPASLSYGSDAMAGVIHFITAPTLPSGAVNGALYTNYQTNNGLWGSSANIAGNLNGFIWDLRASSKLVHAYKNRYDGYVYNSSFSEKAFSAIVGLNRSWGYSHLHLSYYRLQPGIVEGERDSVSGKFIKPVVLNDSTLKDSIVSDEEMKRYGRGVPYQDILHYKAVLNNSFIFGEGRLAVTAGWQQNQRKEFGNAFLPDNYGLYLLLNTINYDVHYLFPSVKDWNISAGVNGMQQVSLNKGTEFLVPAYDLFDIGGFVVAKHAWKKLDLSGGVRYDLRRENGDQLLLDSSGAVVTSAGAGVTEKFASFHSVFTGFSASAGLAYQFSDHVFSKLNFSRGFRAPSIGELGANGEHEGTGRYEKGNHDLRPESSLQCDAAFGIDAKHVSFEADGFYNAIHDFIFLSKVNAGAGGDSLIGGKPVFNFRQGDAALYGGELLMDIHPHPLDWLHIENSFSYVRAIQQHASDSTRDLPFTPAPRIISELRADLKKHKHFHNTYVRIEMQNSLAQTRIYYAFGTETATPAYTLFNAGIGTDVVSSKGNKLFSIHILCSNLTDAAYQDHLNRLKYAPVNYESGRRGVYNMGRNISFKLVIPFDVKKPA